MNIWILNHYAVPLKYYYLARCYYFSRELIKRGHSITVFAASSVHNSEVNLISGTEKYREIYEDGIKYVVFRAKNYKGSGKERILNHVKSAAGMLRYCPKLVDEYGKPDIIFAEAGQTLTLAAGIKLAKKFGIPCVCEVADLWPESFAAYGMIDAANPVMKLLYAGERWVYKNADALIFTMAGGRDYIIEKCWDKAHGGPVDLSKVYHINNGVDLAAFDYNKEHYVLDDADLDDIDTFKAVYTGSLRKVNNVGMLVDAARCLKARGESKIKILVYGDGDERENLENAARESGLDNIVFKGRVEKKYIPSILSRGELCLLHWKPTPIEKYGMSMNKMFDYLASGRPILETSVPSYDIVERYKCGAAKDIKNAEDFASCIKSMAELPEEEYKACCENSRRAAENYDFTRLADKLCAVLDGSMH